MLHFAFCLSTLVPPLMAMYLLYSQHLKNSPGTPVAPGLPHPLVFPEPPRTKNTSIFLLPQPLKEDSWPEFLIACEEKNYIYKIYLFYMQQRTNNIYLSTALPWKRKLIIPSTFNLMTKNSLSIIEPWSQVCFQCHSTRSGPTNGNACDKSGLDTVAVNPGLLVFYLLPFLSVNFLFSHVTIFIEHRVNGWVVLVIPLAQGRCSHPSCLAKLRCPWQHGDFFMGPEELVILWKLSLLWYPTMS